MREREVCFVARAFCQFKVKAKGRERESNNRNNSNSNSNNKHHHQNTNMFDGVPDQLHQFIASSRTTSLPIPLTFPIHGNNTTNNTFPSFDPYPPSSNLQSHLLRPLLLHHPSPTHRDDERDSLMISTTDLVLERERLASKPIDPWSNDEVLALLRIRSSLENWFPDFTWEHVSRKLAELGFKRSAEKCKDKFEEESRYFNMNTNINYNNSNNNNNKHNYRFLSELEELCHGDDESTVNEHIEDENSNEKMVVEKPNEEVEGQEEDKIAQSLVEEVDCVDQNKEEEEEVVVAVAKKSKGEKRKREFEMMKCFCEGFVKNLMAQQEELYNKILEDMVKRDEENFAREEAWKKQEMDRFNKEIEIRANEQAIAGDRQATINEFLKKFTSSPDFKTPFFVELVKEPNSSNTPTTSPTTILAQQNPNPTCELEITQNKLEKIPTSSTMVVSHQNPSSCPNQNNPNALISLTETLPPQNPSSTLVPNISNVTTSSTLALAAQNDSSMPTSNSTHKTPQSPNSLNTQSNPSMPTSNSTYKTHQNPKFGSNDEDKDLGKRWPRDEVLALINIRSNFYNTNEDKEGSANNNKGPLWEKISQGMLDLGYKRSAKRCKEKWENINKYFRKTKDNVNKKRSFDSRTCPYFHQLSNLYKQGTPSNWSENHSPSPENHPNLPEIRSEVPLGVSNKANKHADQGEKNMIQTPSFDFEF